MLAIEIPHDLGDEEATADYKMQEYHINENANFMLFYTQIHVRLLLYYYINDDASGILNVYLLKTHRSILSLLLRYVVCKWLQLLTYLL